MNRVKIIDFLSGKTINKFYTTYNKSQWFTPVEMRDYQMFKLKRLLKHCFDNVAFYRNVMISKNISPNDIVSFEVLNEFPIINKEIIKENYEAFIPKNIKKIKGVKYGQTGGTTGNILIKRTDSNVRSSTWATFKRFYDWMGIDEKSRKLRLMGGHIKKDANIFNTAKLQINDFLNNTKSINPYDISDKNISLLLKELKSNNYKMLKGYSQNLFFLSNYFDNLGHSFNIPVITTTAEPLLAEHRKAFKRTFNADSFDQYGCGEIGGIAYECNHHNGLHIAEERVYIEFTKSNELIITDLDNMAMPYIRYYNADQAIPASGFCTCGRKSLLLKQILGRTCDYITCTNGKQLHWAYFWHLLFDTEVAIQRNMKKFQIIQKEPNQIDFRIVSDPLNDNDKSVLRDLIINQVGKININFLQEPDIENSISGKYQPIINLTIRKDLSKF